MKTRGEVPGGCGDFNPIAVSRENSFNDKSHLGSELSQVVDKMIKKTRSIFGIEVREEFSDNG